MWKTLLILLVSYNCCGNNFCSCIFMIPVYSVPKTELLEILIILFLLTRFSFRTLEVHFICNHRRRFFLEKGK